jgi:hypothetical protein
MKQEDILKQIAQLKTAEEKIAFLKSLLKQIKDERVKKVIEGIIKQMEPQKKEEKEEGIEEIVSELPKGGDASVPESRPLKIEEYKPRQITIDTEVEAEKPEAEKKGDANQTLTSYLRTEAAQRQNLEQAQQRDKASDDYERILGERMRADNLGDMTQEIKFARKGFETHRPQILTPQAEGMDTEHYKTKQEMHEALEITERIKWRHGENHLTIGKLDKYKRKPEEL